MHVLVSHKKTPAVADDLYITNWFCLHVCIHLGYQVELGILLYIV